MTFHAPRSRGRVFTLVARRLIASRSALVAVGAIVTTTVVLAGRGEDTPIKLIEGSFLKGESLVLRHLGLPAPEKVAAVPQRAALSRLPDTLIAPEAAEDTVESSLGLAEDEGRHLAIPDKPTPSDGDSLSETAAHLFQDRDLPAAAPPKAFEIARLDTRPDSLTHDRAPQPRFPESGRLPIIPAVARLPQVDTDIDRSFVETEPFILTLRAESGEALDRLLERSGMLDDDRRATVIALRADAVEESLVEGDLIDIAFIGKHDRDLLAIRMRQQGKKPIELRWDSDTEPLWTPLDRPATATAEAVEPVEPATLSVTGKPDDTIFVAGEINSSLFRSATKVGLTAGETKALENIFRYSIDFERDLRKGDRFEALFEKGVNGAYGDILYAKLTNRGSEIALYRAFDSETGEAGYFDASGKTNKRSLMRTPVAGARVSSHFGMRHHPILGYNKMHRGTDFRAQRGTPIFAAGDGIVDYIGRNGAYGKYIRIRHNSSYETAYAHMSRYAGGLNHGDRVRQGDVIGYVGSTGRSTGPHLHFEILKNGTQINPLKIADFGPVKGLSGAALSRFLVRVSRIEVALSLLKSDVRVAEVN